MFSNYEIDEIKYYFEIATFDFIDNTLQEKCLDAIDSILATYVNGTHSQVDELSFYERLHSKSNQSLERYNRFKNRKGREKANGAKPTSEYFYL